MKFGYMSTLEMPPDKDYALLIDELREQAVLCEQGGFDHVWLAEHHFGVHGRDNSPNPFMLATDIGARTERIRLGIAVVVLPLWHPLRVAENIALLDQMFRGRVDIGFGRASQPHEVVTFNSAADPRNIEGSREVFAESLEIVRKACTEKFFSHHGKHYQLPPPGTTWASRKGWRRTRCGSATARSTSCAWCRSPTRSRTRRSGWRARARARPRSAPSSG